MSAAICAVDSMFILDDGREYEYLNQMRLGKSSIYLVWLPSILPLYLNAATLIYIIILNYTIGKMVFAANATDCNEI